MLSRGGDWNWFRPLPTELWGKSSVKMILRHNLPNLLCTILPEGQSPQHAHLPLLTSIFIYCEEAVVEYDENIINLLTLWPDQWPVTIRCQGQCHTHFKIVVAVHFTPATRWLGRISTLVHSVWSNSIDFNRSVIPLSHTYRVFAQT